MESKFYISAKIFLPKIWNLLARSAKIFHVLLSIPERLQICIFLDNIFVPKKLPRQLKRSLDNPAQKG